MLTNLVFLTIVLSADLASARVLWAVCLLPSTSQDVAKTKSLSNDLKTEFDSERPKLVKRSIVRVVGMDDKTVYFVTGPHVLTANPTQDAVNSAPQSACRPLLRDPNL